MDSKFDVNISQVCEFGRISLVKIFNVVFLAAACAASYFSKISQPPTLASLPPLGGRIQDCVLKQPQTGLEIGFKVAA